MLSHDCQHHEAYLLTSSETRTNLWRNGYNELMTSFLYSNHQSDLDNNEVHIITEERQSARINASQGRYNTKQCDVRNDEILYGFRIINGKMVAYLNVCLGDEAE